MASRHWTPRRKQEEKTDGIGEPIGARRAPGLDQVEAKEMQMALGIRAGQPQD